MVDLEFLKHIYWETEPYATVSRKFYKRFPKLTKQSIREEEIIN